MVKSEFALIMQNKSGFWVGELRPENTPSRIVSVVPSQTELLYQLGLSDEVVGITLFCVHPEHWFNTKERVGGTKKLKPDKIKALKPDLILANKEENNKEQIELLANEFPVYVTNVWDLNSAYEMIIDVGKLVGRLHKSQQTVETISNRFKELHSKTKKKACYLIWKDPYMTVGADTFIHEMMQKAGFENVFETEQRYPKTSILEIKAQTPEVILLSSEPFPFKEKHKNALQKEFPDTEIVIVDGELFSWYGSRLQYSPAYFQKLRNSVE